MNSAVQIKVKFNRRAFGGYTAIADEDKAGYAKGEIIMVFEYELRRIPDTLLVFPRPQKTVFNEAVQ